MTIRSRLAFCFLFFFSLILFFQCKKEIVPEIYKPSNSHEAYIHALRTANLAHTALARDWILVSKKSLENPVNIETPFEEVSYIDPSAAFAVAYRFEVKKGQRTEIDVVFQGQKRCRLFIDLFRVEGPSVEGWDLIASANENERHLEFEPRQDAEYVIRLQPELLRGGRFQVTIRSLASIGFPVLGYDSRSIGSGFGEPRDGGRRLHHGVDIFSPRHTPVIAPTKAYVRRVEVSNIGGRNIWLYDEVRGLHFYFAHLQTQDVEQGTYVVEGQRIGTVGNTGNARRTPPHLHFGIYARGEGPIDPYHFITKTNSTPKEITADLEMLGQWTRSNSQSTSLKSMPSSRSQDLIRLEKFSAMKVLAAAGDMYRVLLPDGRTGYVPARRVELAQITLETQQAEISKTVKDAPMENAVVVEEIRAGEEFSILGQFEAFWLIRTSSDKLGWVLTSSLGPQAHSLRESDSR
jgi:murein DD-endopeptidase MepM/ murein hydrolase activator NlpD